MQMLYFCVVILLRYGVCLSDFEKAGFLYDLGYDYLEFNLASVAGLDKIEFGNLLKKCRNSLLKAETFNCFINRKIVGEAIDTLKFEEYLKIAMERAKSLGGEVLVLGSGKARNIPAGFPREKAMRQLTDFVNMAGEEAQKYDMYIALENLNKNETNVLNTIEEGIDLINQIHNPHVKLLADFYHMKVEKENFKILEEAGSDLYHVHIANSHGRVYPRQADEDSYDSFFEELNIIGYDRRISVEAGIKSGNDYKDAVNVLKYLTKKIYK